MSDPEVQVFATPLPVLADDDPVLTHVARLAGAHVVAGNPPTLNDCNGLGWEDLKAACYQAREEQMGLMAYQTGAVVRSDRDGWAKDTVVTDGDEAMPLDEATTQAVFGVWVEADSTMQPWDSQERWLYGYSYDMHLAAALFCDMWASAIKTEFDFNDGSGNYSRSQKYQQVRDTERSQRSKARVQVGQMTRPDTSPNASSLTMDEWFRRMGNG